MRARPTWLRFRSDHSLTCAYIDGEDANGELLYAIWRFLDIMVDIHTSFLSHVPLIREFSFQYFNFVN